VHRLPAHRVVLGAQSEYFRALLVRWVAEGQHEVGVRWVYSCCCTCASTLLLVVVAQAREHNHGDSA